jgi:hypothetical protein
VRRPATVALEQEAELAVTKQQLQKALAAQKLTPTSRKVLSRARQATWRDLPMLGTPGSMRRVVAGRGKRQGQGETDKGGQRKRHEACGGRLDDSEVERQVEEFMRLDEEEEEG